jgi:hypothetical protein
MEFSSRRSGCWRCTSGTVRPDWPPEGGMCDLGRPLPDLRVEIAMAREIGAHDPKPTWPSGMSLTELSCSTPRRSGSQMRRHAPSRGSKPAELGALA